MTKRDVRLVVLAGIGAGMGAAAGASPYPLDRVDLFALACIFTGTVLVVRRGVDAAFEAWERRRAA